MHYDELSALSPVVRKEVLTGELSRRVKALENVPTEDVDVVVESLVGLTLGEVVQGIQDPVTLEMQVRNIRNGLKPSQFSSPDKSPSPSASQDSRLLDPNALNATASAPEHPSTPISITASLCTPPRTSSPSGSVPPTSERDRINLAVTRLESTRQTELTDLLMSLPKRERAMCLFNVEVLRAKIADAKNVLDSEDGPEEEQLPPPPPVRETQSAKSTPLVSAAQPTRKAASTIDDSPQTPDLSSRGPSAAASPVPVTPGTTYTIASLARLPAVEILKIAKSSSATGLPLPKEDPIVVQATDEFVDSLMDKPIQQQKQQLGDKL
jgi:polyadenylate-binding protein